MKATQTIQMPKPGTDVRALKVFVGTWHAEGTSFGDGQNADDPRASAVPWISDETYEWLPGEFYLLHRWDARAGKRHFVGTEIIGHDSVSGYFAQMFDNAGNHPEYRVHREEKVWTFKEAQTRATITVNNRNTMTVNWQWKNGGTRWLALCERIARRIV